MAAQVPVSTKIRTGGNDAVAFTSGHAGAPFSAGVVHAWLAADREKPLVATGISMGSVAAAAMRRVYQELEEDTTGDLEVRRWRWYQRYHQAVTDKPFAPLWNALPDPVDFFSETPPVKDPSVLLDFETNPQYRHLLESSEDARRHFYLLVLLGGWLGTLPVRISTIATCLVMYVRNKEGYGRNPVTWIILIAQALALLAGLWTHIVFAPKFLLEGHFRGSSRRHGLRPLFGWGAYLLAVFVPPLMSVIFYAIVRFLFGVTSVGSQIVWVSICLLIAIIAAVKVLCELIDPPFKLKKKVATAKRTSFGKFFISRISANLGIAQSLIHPFQIQRSLYDLFVKQAPDCVTNGPSGHAVNALIVCAALQELDQVSLKESCNVVDALTAALAVPGLLPPKRVPAAQTHSKNPITENYDVIDGAAVRNNPIPAFFSWCRQNAHIAKQLETKDVEHPSLHVVYSVPIGYDGSIADPAPMACPDIVDSAFSALRLAKRRDTRQEVRQANTVSQLESIRRRVLPNIQTNPRESFTIFANEIAPREDIDLGNPLAPDSEKLCRTVADGCRGSLETLYHKEIGSLLYGDRTAQCATLLRKIAPRRADTITKFPGLPAVCQHCTRRHEHRSPSDPAAPQLGIQQTYGDDATRNSGDLAGRFNQLAHDVSRVIFLGSGGVFRGAFHIGVIAAMNQTQLYPDIVIGASVGTLMGGALCSITADNTRASGVISTLTDLFTHVDKTVSLTAILKGASKQLGTRARCIRLAPSKLARKIKAGSQADAGFAATGAPPELTDAISSLLTIPHTKTMQITADFVAGHFSAATAAFLKQVRHETLNSFNIKNCLMGVSLLEVQARNLLRFSEHGKELDRVQPYQSNTPSGRSVAFFGMTSFLNCSTSFLLGRDFISTRSSWDAVEAGLCSSAFPTVFAARSEADLLPGVGRSDRFFADGGMFDNLPFFPAFEVIAHVQLDNSKIWAVEKPRLHIRSANPSVIVCAGLNEKPELDPNFCADTLFAIRNRAQKLSYESKTRTFISSAADSNNLFADILQGDDARLTDADKLFLMAYVPSKIVDITPIDANHINGTFAFCKTLGMNPLRIEASIADGCFQTLKQLADEKGAAHSVLEAREHLVTLSSESSKSAGVPNVVEVEHSCHYFKIRKEAFECPFAKGKSDVAAVYKVCSKDPAHQEAAGGIH